jgi:hypothetical protein
MIVSGFNLELLAAKKGSDRIPLSPDCDKTALTPPTIFLVTLEYEL